MMKPRLPQRIAIAGLLAATGGCMTSAGPIAFPDGTRFTSNSAASLTTADRLLADGNYGLAIEMYRRMLAAAPDNADAVEGLALSYDRLRRYDLSDVYFQKALALAPRNDAFYRAYGASLTTQGRQDEAALLDVDRRAMLAGAQAAATTPPQQPAAATAPSTVAAATPSREAAPAPVAPVLAGAATVPVVAPPMSSPRARLEQLAPGVVRLTLPPEMRSVGGATVSIPIPPRASAIASRPAVAPPPSPAGALRNTMVINAIGRKGVAARVQSFLAGRGWQPLDRGDSGMRIATSRILYPPVAEATARKLAQVLPFPTRLYAMTKANRVQLLIGGNALRFDAKRAARRR
jgi:hypothetical protein